MIYHWACARRDPRSSVRSFGYDSTVVVVGTMICPETFLGRVLVTSRKEILRLLRGRLRPPCRWTVKDPLVVTCQLTRSGVHPCLNRFSRFHWMAVVGAEPGKSTDFKEVDMGERMRMRVSRNTGER
jgi:hypothetical protein